MAVPLEKHESEILANRLDKYNYTFSAIRNESDTRSFYKGKIRRASGVRKGIPDFFLILKRGAGCFIELKRQRPVSKKSGKLLKSPSKVTEEQKVWIASLSLVPNMYASICYGAKEAVDFILENEAR